MKTISWLKKYLIYIHNIYASLFIIINEYRHTKHTQTHIIIIANYSMIMLYICRLVHFSMMES